jgi:hypothetical protein
VLFVSGVMMLAFATHPAMLVATHNALSDLTVMVFGARPEFWSDRPLTKADRLIVGAIGATLIFVSGAMVA